MHALLEPATTHRSFARLIDWVAGHCDAVLAREGEVVPTAAVLDAGRSVHVWALPWRRLASDASADDLWREELPGEVRAVGGEACAVTLPAWLAEDGTVWVLGPGHEPGGGWDEVVLAGAADRHESVTMIGSVRRHREACVRRWDHAALPRSADPAAALARAMR